MWNVRKEIRIGNLTMHTTTSLGGAFFNGQNITAEALVVLADKALYRAKEMGRDRDFWMMPGVL